MAAIDPALVNLGVFVAAAAAALVAFGAALVNYWFFRSQVDPQVIVYTTPDPDNRQIILLIIENTGRGMARHVTFELPKQIPVLAFKSVEELQQMYRGPFIDGLPALGPGARRVIKWGEYKQLVETIREDVINVTVRYRGEPVGPYLPHWYESTFPIEIRSFLATDATDANWSKKTAEALEGIHLKLGEISHRLRMLGPPNPPTYDDGSDEVENE